MPFENSIEGSVRSTLDTLAFDTEAVTIVGEYDFAVHAHLIAREGVELEQIAAVLSHPQPLAQCAGFLRENLPGVERRSVSSTAEAVRMVGESVRPWAAIGARAAADLYGCTVLREGIEDADDNVTRFVWIAPSETEPAGEGPWRTSLVFSELGADHPGALVDALQEFSVEASTSAASSQGPCARASAATCSSATSKAQREIQPSPRLSRHCAKRPSPCAYWAPTRSADGRAGVSLEPADTQSGRSPRVGARDIPARPLLPPA